MIFVSRSISCCGRRTGLLHQSNRHISFGPSLDVSTQSHTPHMSHLSPLFRPSSLRNRHEWQGLSVHLGTTCTTPRTRYHCSLDTSPQDKSCMCLRSIHHTHREIDRPANIFRTGRTGRRLPHSRRTNSWSMWSGLLRMLGRRYMLCKQ